MRRINYERNIKMKISHKEKIEKEIEKIDDIICNKCGKSCRAYPESSMFSGLLEYRFNGCYGSEPLEDMTGYIFSICNPCLKEIFDTFKIPVVVIDYLNSGTIIGEEPDAGPTLNAYQR